MNVYMLAKNIKPIYRRKFMFAELFKIFYPRNFLLLIRAYLFWRTSKKWISIFVLLKSKYKKDKQKFEKYNAY